MPSRMIPATDRDEALASFDRLVLHFLPGRDLVATIEEYVPERTVKQRKSLFGVAYKSLMEQMGLHGEREKDQLHEMMCGEYWGWRDSVMLGSAKRVPVRTTTTNERGERDVISTREQLDFYAWIQQRAAEHGYDIPDPDKEWFRKAEREAELEEQARRNG